MNRQVYRKALSAFSIIYSSFSRISYNFMKLTVKHRARMLEKFGFRNASELAYQAELGSRSEMIYKLAYQAELGN